jgi:hypothetical protein
VFTNIYSLLIEKDIRDCQNVSIKVLCVCVCLSSGDLFIFSVKVSTFFSYFLISVLQYFPFYVIYWNVCTRGIIVPLWWMPLKTRSTHPSINWLTHTVAMFPQALTKFTRNTTKIAINGETLTKKWRGRRMKGTNKRTHGNLINLLSPHVMISHHAVAVTQ